MKLTPIRLGTDIEIQVGGLRVIRPMPSGGRWFDKHAYGINVGRTCNLTTQVGVRDPTDYWFTAIIV